MKLKIPHSILTTACSGALLFAFGKSAYNLGYYGLLKPKLESRIAHAFHDEIHSVTNRRVKPGEVAETDTAIHSESGALNQINTYYYLGVTQDKRDFYLRETSDRINHQREMTEEEKEKRKQSNGEFFVYREQPNTPRDTFAIRYGLVSRQRDFDAHWPQTMQIGYHGQEHKNPATDLRNLLNDQHCVNTELSDKVDQFRIQSVSIKSGRSIVPARFLKARL